MFKSLLILLASIQFDYVDQHYDFSLSSILLFLLLASLLSCESIGLNSPNPAAISLVGGTPCSIRYRTTDVARADDSSQLSANRLPADRGMSSVCPSTLSTQARNSNCRSRRSCGPPVPLRGHDLR